MSETVAVGMEVRIVAVDWNRHLYQINPSDVEKDVRLVRATIYGQIVKLDGELLAVAPQVFENGDSREVLAIPIACVESLEVATWSDGFKPDAANAPQGTGE